jgi:hypothetical protein
MKLAWLLLATGVLAGAALAELPPPTPVEKAKLEKSAAEKAATTKDQEQALARVQERIARQYRASHPGRGSRPPTGAVMEPVTKDDISKEAKQPPGAPAKPYEGRKPNPAEAHSQQ